MTDPTRLQEAIADAIKDLPVKCWWTPGVDADTATLTAESALAVSQAVEKNLTDHPTEVLAALGMEQVGVDFCVTHQGVRNEDEEGCDFAHHNDQRCVLTAAYVHREDR